MFWSGTGCGNFYVCWSRVSHSWRLKSCVNRSVGDIFVFHWTQNLPNNLICWKQNTLESHTAKTGTWYTNYTVTKRLIIYTMQSLIFKTYHCHVGPPCKTSVSYKTVKMFIFNQLEIEYVYSLICCGNQVLPSTVWKIDEQQIADRCIDAEMRQSVCVYKQRSDAELFLQQSWDGRGAWPLYRRKRHWWGRRMQRSLKEWVERIIISLTKPSTFSTTV